jgi:unsaturated chondroitin disaccharide hydrolase
VRRLVEAHPDYFPMYSVEGRWKHAGEAWTNWCEGFLGGMLWIFHRRTGDPWWRAQAEHYSRLIEGRKHDREVHDLGFLFWPTWKKWYDLTGDQAVHEVVITAGRTLGLRFKEKGGYCCSFLADESLFIDIMMNVGIIFYAAQQTGDQDLLEKAHRHCRTTRRYLVRGDGGTAHEGIFDTETGEFLRQSTQQGWRADSTWARGLTWALYGFGEVYRLTGDLRYLDTARLCADFYLRNTPFEEDAPGGPGVPPNDYDDPAQSGSGYHEKIEKVSGPGSGYHEKIKMVSGLNLFDSSAAAIAAGGLLNLAELVQDPLHAEAYLKKALTILHTLTGPDYLANEDPPNRGGISWEGILKHGVYHLPKNLGVDESVMWGEYFFVEALDRALDLPLRSVGAGLFSGEAAFNPGPDTTKELRRYPDPGPDTTKELRRYPDPGPDTTERFGRYPDPGSEGEPQ